MRLCDHVDLDVRKDDKRVVVESGAVYPYFSWSRDKQADVPRLKCSVCGKMVNITGYVVERDHAI